ncbi:MAG: GNAT family N-acetyltransferase [Ginsengibacter sp.]
MSTNLKIEIRPASIDDKDFIISLLPRLIEFGPPYWRDVAQLIAVDTKVLSDKLTNQPLGTVIFIAEDDKHVALGFIHLQTGADYYNSQKHGHIADIIVTPETEGCGIGRALMEKAEDWARAEGFRWLTLSVFAQNLKAREVYKRFGYGEDIMKYVKELT